MVDGGMAKPMFWAGALPLLDEATAVFIPIDLAGRVDEGAARSCPS